MLEILLQFALLALGFVMLAKGADWFVEGAAGIAARFGIPQLIIGLTIVAMGTSAPEAAVSITAAMEGSADITIGNILGSNIMNVFVILGAAAVITPLAVTKLTMKVDIPFVIGISIVLFLLGQDAYITRMDGMILAVFFFAYLAYLYIMASKNRAAMEDDLEYNFSMGRSLGFGALGLALIIFGSNVTVNAATSIAKYAGLSERFIGLTIVALGTSLPELFTSVVAAYKGNADIAIGNIVGSNIFNILFVVGLSSLIVDIPFAAAFTFDAYMTIAAVVLLEVLMLFTMRIERWGGAILLAGYAYYFWSIL